jgi:hypothetical protein
MNVINVRGTTGSGKTSIIRALMNHQTFSPPLTISEGVVGHYSRDYALIGPYREGSNFGGVDAIKKISYVNPAIAKALQTRPTVIFEGLLISHSYDRWVEFSKRLQGVQMELGEKPHGLIMAFITPPFRENIKRLKKRNNIKGSLRESKGNKFILNFISRYKSICRIRNKAVLDTALGHMSMRILDYKDPFKDLQFLLISGIIKNNNKLLPRNYKRI